MKKNNINIFISISFILYLTLIYMIPEKTKIFTIAFIGSLVIYYLFKKKYFINKEVFIPILLYIFVGIFSLFSTNSSINDAAEIIVALVMGLFIVGLDFNKELRNRICNGLLVICIFVIIGCFLQVISPNILFKINLVTLGVQKYEMFHIFYRANSLVGFSYQTAITGFYLTIMLGYVICLLLSKKINNLFYKFLLIISLILIYCMIFFTGKRIFILLSLLVSMYIFCIFNKKHINKILFIAVFLGLGLFFLLNYTDYGEKILQRSTDLDPTTGRLKIYSQLIGWFWDNPFFGNGLGSTIVMLKGYQNGHNVYLQLLSETGIIGFLLVMSFFIISLVNSIFTVKKCISQNHDTFVSSFCLFIQLIFLGWCFTGNPLYDVYPLVIYMFSIGIVFKIKKNMIYQGE